MLKLLRIALHEYTRRVFTRRFLIALFSPFLAIVVTTGLFFIVTLLENDNTPLGYVDHSGLLTDPLPAPKKPYQTMLPILPFETEAQARSALEAEQIQGYYIIPADYPDDGHLTVVFKDKIRQAARQQFYDFLAVNLLRRFDEAIAHRLLEGSKVVILSPDGNWVPFASTFLNFFLPFLIGTSFVIIMFVSGGYLLQAVTDEKENRTIEVVLTSVSTEQFMAGKIIGNMAVGWTQIATWFLFGALGLLAGRASVESLREVQIASQMFLLIVFIILPSFVTISALMAAIGASVTEAREANTVISILVLPLWIPHFLISPLMNNPHSLLAITLSLLPFTAPLSLFIRNGVTLLPDWQIAISAAIQVTAAIGSLWLAGRAFWLGMLRYGKRLRWREVFGGK